MILPSSFFPKIHISIIALIFLMHDVNVDFRILTFLFFTLTLTMSNCGKADENRSNESGGQKKKWFF